jgi:hypothetical protein
MGSENICSNSGGAQEKQDETQFTTTKIARKISFEFRVISFCKIFIPCYMFDALLCWNWLFSPR